MLVAYLDDSADLVCCVRVDDSHWPAGRVRGGPIGKSMTLDCVLVKADGILTKQTGDLVCGLPSSSVGSLTGSLADQQTASMAV